MLQAVTFGRVFGQGLLAAHGHEFDVIHASPPCQFGSEATPMAYREKHLNLIPQTRALLRASGKPYIIENVENVKGWLQNPIMLCGSMFGLSFWRHRYFETVPDVFPLLPPCDHNRRPRRAIIDGEERSVQVPVLVSGGGDGKRAKRKNHRPRGKVAEIRWAMDTPWMVQSELTEAIPPVYTEFLGRQLIAVLTEAYSRPRPF